MNKVTRAWDTALKICIGLMPFIITFLVWVTMQINALQTEAALARQSRQNLAAAQRKVDVHITEIKNTQLQILLVLEQIKATLQKD